MTDWGLKTAHGPGDFVWFRKNKEDRVASVIGIEHRYTIEKMDLINYTGYIVNTEEGPLCVLKQFCFNSPQEMETFYAEEDRKNNN